MEATGRRNEIRRPEPRGNPFNPNMMESPKVFKTEIWSAEVLSQLPLAPGRQSRPRDRLRRAAAARACPARVRKARVCKGAREGGRGAREGGEGNGLGHFDYGKPPGVCARGAGTDRQRKREREREREGATGIELWRVYFHCGGFILSSLSKLDYVN